MDVTDRTQVPAAPYWRMLVLDQYDNGVFKYSAGLRRELSGPRTTAVLRGEARPRLGAPVFWTFYFESGVSRYMPLLGHFEELRFREAQNFRFAASLGVLELREEPVTMTAYRVEGGVIRSVTALSSGNRTEGAPRPRSGPSSSVSVTRSRRQRGGARSHVPTTFGSMSGLLSIKSAALGSR